MTGIEDVQNRIKALVESFGPEKAKAFVAEALGLPVGQLGTTLLEAQPIATMLNINVTEGTVELIQAIVGRVSEFMDQAEKIRAAGKIAPAEYFPLLSPDQLARVFDQLEGAGYEIEQAATTREAAYGNRNELKAREVELEGQIKAIEAEAIMKIEYEGRDAYVMIGEKKQKLTNDTARDAYRRMASKEQREELTRVRADIAKIEAGLAPATDRWQKAVEASSISKAKAGLQEALLKYLARG